MIVSLFITNFIGFETVLMKNSCTMNNGLMGGAM